MTTFYLDPSSAGNDASAGTSWATAWQTFTTGATSARLTAGDTIRVIRSPDPVNTGLTGTFTSGAYQSNLYKTGTSSVAITSSTNASPIVVTSSGTHGLVTGDVVGIGGHATNTNANGVWTITVLSTTTFSLTGSVGNGGGGGTGGIYRLSNQMVVLSAPVTSTISNCETSWTNGTSCVASLENTNWKEGLANAAKLTITTPATSTKLAYVLTTNTNYASYNQISFWIRNTVAVTAGQYNLCLCSDTGGATVVTTIAIPAIPSTNQYCCFTVDTGSALPSSVQSVALYTGSTTGTSNVLNLDHIIACLPSSSVNAITLTSLIGKNNGTEGWYNIRSINGTLINLDHSVNSNWMASRGYYGVSETVALWRRETFKVPLAAKSADTGNAGVGVNFLQKSGTSSSPITISGGWDSTSNTQTGSTYWDGSNGYGVGLGINFGNTLSYLNISGMNFSRFACAIGNWDGSQTWAGCVINVFNVTNCKFMAAIFNPGNTITVSNLSFSPSDGLSMTNNGGSSVFNLGFVFAINNQGVLIAGTSNVVNISGFIAGCTTGSNQACVGFSGGSGNSVIGVGSSPIVITGGTASSNPNYGIGMLNSAINLTVKNLAVSNSATYDIFANTGTNVHYINACSFSTASVGSNLDERVYCRNPNGVVSAKAFSDNMTCQTDLTTVHTSGNRSWNITTSRTLSTYPATLNLGYVVIQSGVTNTISAWVRYDTAGMTAGIQVLPNQIEGMTTLARATSTGTANTWIQVTLTITTATQSGPVMLQAYGLSSSGTQNMWVADITIS